MSGDVEEAFDCVNGASTVTAVGVVVCVMCACAMITIAKVVDDHSAVIAVVISSAVSTVRAVCVEIVITIVIAICEIAVIAITEVACGAVVEAGVAVATSAANMHVRAVACASSARLRIGGAVR
jgi:hypothetical protein